MVVSAKPLEALLVRAGVRTSLSQALGSGAEGTVFSVPGSDLAAKVYHQPTPELEEKVEAMLDKTLPGAGLLPPDYSIAWPVDTLRRADDGRWLGFVMPRCRWDYSLFQAYHPKKRGADVDRTYLLRAAKNLAFALHTLHGADVRVGDLNESNAVFARGGHVTLLDTDSFEVRARSGRVFRCLVGKAEFTASELVGKKFADVNRTRESDAFALAVAVWLLLMEGHHPFASLYTGPGQGASLPERIAKGLWPYAKARPRDYLRKPGAPRFGSLPPGLRELFRRAFEDGHRNHGARPRPAEWVTALEAAASCAGTARSPWWEPYVPKARLIRLRDKIEALLPAARKLARSRWAWAGGAAALVLVALLIFLPRSSPGIGAGQAAPQVRGEDTPATRLERRNRQSGAWGEETPGLVNELRNRKQGP
jgi:DNA-binding helix-hairpin-helix protein with protein kinase domain